MEQPRTPTQTVAARMKAVRDKRGLTAAALAREMKAQGIPWERITVTKLENGHRASVSVDELLALAVVLNVAPAHLLVPPDDFLEDYAVTPACTEKAARVREWIRGQLPVPVNKADPREYFGEVPRTEYDELIRTGGAATGIPLPQDGDDE